MGFPRYKLGETGKRVSVLPPSEAACGCCVNTAEEIKGD